MNTYDLVLKDLKGFRNLQKQEIFMRFFKTAKGEYGYGDQFWGITVPNIRSIGKKYYKEISFDDIKKLISNDIHEVRLLGYIILTYIFEKGDKGKVYDFYIDNLEGCNNWDIVDLSCSKIIGEYLIENPSKKTILYELVRSENLWKQRIAIVSTFALIRKGEFEDTLKISKILLKHKHDLIHKAVGWMLREVGKKDINVLREFLNENIKVMPRTTLRYAIEKMDIEERQTYLKM